VTATTPSLWRHREFTRLWAGQTVSLVGSQVTTLALPLTAIVLLGAGSVQIGALRAAQLAPYLVVGLVAGAWVDRVHRRPVLIVTNVGRGLVLATIPLAAVLGELRMAHLYVAAVVVGGLTVFFDVAYESFLPSLVRREQLADGNGKLGLSSSLATLIGPGIAGVLVQTMTAPLAIVVDAASFVVSAVSIMSIRAHERRTSARSVSTHLLSEVADGMRIVWRNVLLRTMAASLILFYAFFGVVVTIYLLYAVDELAVSPGFLGVIFAAGGVGTVLGTLLAPRVARRVGIGGAIVWGAVVSDGVFLLLPAISGPSSVTVPLLAAAQLLFGLTAPITAINQLSLRQAITPARYRGRVSATMRVMMLGLGPLTSLAAGALGEVIGLRPTLVVGVVGLQLGALILVLSPLRSLREAVPMEPD